MRNCKCASVLMKENGETVHTIACNWKHMEAEKPMNNNPTELLPCPFCNKPVRLISQADGSSDKVITCVIKCYACDIGIIKKCTNGLSFKFVSEHIIKKWNTRHSVKQHYASKVREAIEGVEEDTDACHRSNGTIRVDRILKATAEVFK